ncbi:MAG: protein kinase [Thermodesulfobacteriota bacterium]
MEEGITDPREAWIKIIESQESIANRFYEINRIDPRGGDGSFSLVFTAVDRMRRKPKRICLKFLDPLAGNEYRRQCFHREADILKDLVGQRNILPLVQEKSRFDLVLSGITFPLYYYGSHLGRFNVKHYIYNEENNFLTNILFFREMCKAIQRIHSKRICHRDLRPDNFLVFNKRYVCLSDFGTARYFGEKSITLLDSYLGPVGDMRYTAPELLCGLHFSDYHNYCADIYSLGANLYELFTKSELASVIYKNDELLEFITHFSLVPEKNRVEVFDGFIDAFSEERNLFPVRMHNEFIPKAIAYEVDRLYQSMACLNYKKREKDFQRIFLRINICEKVIRTHKSRRGEIC